MAYLRSSLDKEAGQVLWDYGTEVTGSLKKLTAILKDRFGGTNLVDKHRLELHNRRRRISESLQNLHTDIRRLAALAFPQLDDQHREVIACDYFIDALADPDFALKVRERAPADLDTALHTALQLEVWTKDVERTRGEQPKQNDRRNREVVRTETPRNTERLQKHITELEAQMAKMAGSNTVRKQPVTAPEVPRQGTVILVSADQRQPITCWGCGTQGHTLQRCPHRVTGEEPKTYRETSQ